MASEVTIAREGGVTSLREVRNAEGRVTGREIIGSKTRLDNPRQALRPFTQFMTEVNTSPLERDMPGNKSSWKMENGNILTVGVKSDGSGAQVRVRERLGSGYGRILAERFNVSNDSQLQEVVRGFWVKHGSRKTK